ncbi:B3/4 domain-containing protein [Streptomyces sp. NPDC053499]|uniref:B3/4 domain-containing protein n=1 Tax=Streptomyces sp. NPDC053499 TaxID=3365707 RepID=UPI0037D410FF
MHFEHSPHLWQDFPQLVPGVLHAKGITARPSVPVDASVRELWSRAAARNAAGEGTESGLPQIQAWRRAFASMGLKPTQYRCAAESLLRRFRREGSLPEIHPLIDLCNAASLAYAIPVGVFDLARIEGDLQVRYALGDERYETFAGDEERPEPGEVVFADEAGRAHARRWTNRQSGRSAVRGDTEEVLIVAEALHETAPGEMAELTEVLADALRTHWETVPRSAVLTRSAPRFEV